MIDFRYHIVSIVSIFLALAVGIVLGAGPLQGEIGSTLQGEIAGLRDDKVQLNADLEASRAEVEQQQAYLAAVSSRVLAGALDGRTVAVVVLPGADAAVGEGLVEAVDAAGGRVASTTSVSTDWVSADEDVAATRDRTVADVATRVGADTRAATLTPRDVLLATLLSRSAPAGDDGPDDATARAGLDALAESGLISLDASDFTRAELVVVVAGSVADGDEAAQTETATRWVGLTSALDARSRGTVLAADVDSEADGVSVLATLRDGSGTDSGTDSTISTVDDAADPVGVASVVFALREQDGGSSGHYGLASGADAPYAPVPGS